MLPLMNIERGPELHIWNPGPRVLVEMLSCPGLDTVAQLVAQFAEGFAL